MKTYLVDFENVKSKGLTGIDLLDKNDKVIIMYSENSDTISFDMHQKVLESKANIEYLKVRVGLKNALDFQLSTLLGYLVAKGENSHIFIISNDKGFDRLHDFWSGGFIQCSNCTVYRTQTIASTLKEVKSKTKTISVVENKQTEKALPVEILTKETEEVWNMPAESDKKERQIEVKKTPSRRGRKPKQNLSELLNELLSDSCNADDIEKVKSCLAGSDSKEDFHNSMAKIFKQQATDFYKILRSKYLRLKSMSDRESPVSEAESNQQPTQLNTELVKLLNGICNNQDIDIIEQCICSTDTKQGLYLSMLKIYKRERGCEIYKILKPEYDNLTALKME